MTNYFTEPIYAAVGIADAVVAKTKELVGSVLGREQRGEAEAEAETGAETGAETEESGGEVR